MSRIVGINQIQFIFFVFFGVIVITVNMQEMFWRVNSGRVKKTRMVFYRSLARIGHEQQKMLV